VSSHRRQAIEGGTEGTPLCSEREFSCRSLSEGVAEGEVIISKDAVCFYLVEYDTGVVIEHPHDINGRNIAGKVLVMPSGKGSSVVQADGLYKLMKNGKAPAAIIVAQPDTVLVSGAIVMDVPLVDRADPAFYETVRDGDRVVVDAVGEKLVLKA
jgi:predicted aconitase with swiveling domain